MSKISVSRRDQAVPGRCHVMEITPSLCLLVTGFCLGLLWLVCSLIFICCKGPEGRRITVFFVSLVFTALLQCLSTPAMVLLHMGETCRWQHCDKLMLLWFATRHCGVFLNLLVVLEFSVASPRYGSKLQAVYVSLPIVLIIVVVCMLFSESTIYGYTFQDANIGLGAAASVLAVLTCATAAQSLFTCSGMERRQVLAVFMAVFTFATYAPSFVMLCMKYNGVSVSPYIYSIMLCLSNLRLVADAQLCCLVSRQTSAPTQKAVLSGHPAAKRSDTEFNLVQVNVM